jgi:RsiW-degrading membrane proteinase PrsW (M82 family)
MFNFFHETLAGGEPADNDAFTQTFVKHFIGTGFFEETFKAIPLLIVAIAGSYMPAAIRAKFGIEEPLDGILLGAASGGGFAVVETLSQFISGSLFRMWRFNAAVWLHGVDPRALSDWYKKIGPENAAKVIQQGKYMMGWKPGLALLIPRSLSEVFGHMAYAGCFGYFIGLAVMKPQQRWKILAIGLVSASLPHALWDTLSDSNVLLGVIGIISYAVLAAAILKAREISPNRAQLMPSIFIGALSPSPSTVAAYAGAPGAVAAGYGAGAVASPPFTPAPFAVTPQHIPVNPLPVGTASLRVGTKYLVIVVGLRLMAHQVPGLHAREAEGLVAEVTRNPNDPEVLGLTNLSTTAWEVVTSNSTRREIQPGQTVKLSPGTKIDFGETDGEVG